MTTEKVTYVGPYDEIELALEMGDVLVQNGESAEVEPHLAANLVEQGTWQYVDGSTKPKVAPAPSRSVRELADKLDVDLNTIDGTGKDGRILKADVESAAPPAEPPAEPFDGEDQTTTPESGENPED